MYLAYRLPLDVGLYYEKQGMLAAHIPYPRYRSRKSLTLAGHGAPYWQRADLLPATRQVRTVHIYVYRAVYTLRHDSHAHAQIVNAVCDREIEVFVSHDRSVRIIHHRVVVQIKPVHIS